ncbi:helix-turn-helix domain-containing protein [Halobaculum gomorrense]|uniref:Predicted DNA binding protein, contains HTH domain n=1 Tax=Halobaculum gomorrense TaxID=43928 RepID=A0A1M5PBU7_9EURY|nr:helix-turn-helix domain-containing protein [Halobaculum gomorrense]SHG99311.1 Predicted DNA binding protein, contains HTH domain [Halobaculum gomorrense]
MISTQIYAEHENLALTPTIRSDADTEISVVTDASTDPDNDVYFFQVETGDLDRLETLLEADHTVASFSLVFEQQETGTYRIEYSEETELLSPPLADVGGLTMGASSHLNGWVLDLQFKDHDGLYALNEYAEGRGIHLDIMELNHVDGYERDTDFGLTEPQREALLAAFDRGYFDEPRESSLEDLAAVMDISPTAVSGRLRRGSKRLIEALLLDEEH